MSHMSQHPIISSRDEIIDTMIDLAHLSRSHRIVIAGSDSTELYLALQRRGFAYPVLASAGRIPRGQHSAALIAGDRSFQAIEATMAQILGFLGAAANIAISIESQESGLGARVRNKLQQLGFRIEGGARCRAGFVLAAHRQDFGQGFGTLANVA
ncbi:MAG TPA: hypothetical protein VE267_02035 [Bradyrhizobium sp.]|nr:hypothetical protein [Bradyrhizobium sp.]